MIVGKELEIRRWLSRSHLYSSAFVVDAKRDANGLPTRFTFYGAGWGHGVGLCQIGAAVMAARGKKAEEIVLHYFSGAGVEKLY
jgi:stage II sporulation protein D